MIDVLELEDVVNVIAVSVFEDVAHMFAVWMCLLPENFGQGSQVAHYSEIRS